MAIQYSSRKCSTLLFKYIDWILLIYFAVVNTLVFSNEHRVAASWETLNLHPYEKKVWATTTKVTLCVERTIWNENFQIILNQLLVNRLIVISKYLNYMFNSRRSAQMFHKG